jgi:hypothetical protein
MVIAEKTIRAAIVKATNRAAIVNVVWFMVVLSPWSPAALLQVSAARPRIVVGQGFTPRRYTMDSSMRYFGCAAGFGFGVLWMTEGIGPAVLCLLLAGLGYGAVLVAERAQADPSLFRLPSRTAEATTLPLQAEELNSDLGHLYEPSDDASSPLSAEVEYGWPMEEQELAQTPSR